jgi:nicotinamide riboside kinase
MIRIAITGPECSGKSTLSGELAEHLGVNYIPEYARLYLDKLGKSYLQIDLDSIAQRQQIMIDAVAASEQNYLISDSEMLVMKIWSEEKYNNVSSVIKNLYENQTFDLYLLCKPDIPFVADSQRENPLDRDRLYKIYKSELQKQSVHFVEVKGAQQERLDNALTAISELLSK